MAIGCCLLLKSESNHCNFSSLNTGALCENGCLVWFVPNLGCGRKPQLFGVLLHYSSQISIEISSRLFPHICKLTTGQSSRTLPLPPLPLPFRVREFPSLSSSVQGCRLSFFLTEFSLTACSLSHSNVNGCTWQLL